MFYNCNGNAPRTPRELFRELIKVSSPAEPNPGPLTHQTDIATEISAKAQLIINLL